MINIYNTYFTIFLMELKKIITYRSNFWVNFFGQTIFSLLVYYYIWHSIFKINNVTELNGFTLKELVLYYLLAPLISRILQGQGIGHLSREIFEGAITKYLIYPISYIGYKLTHYFSHSLFYFVQLIILTLIFSIFVSPIIFHISIYNMIAFSIIVFFGSFLYFQLSAICELISFWADNVWSLGVMLRFAVSFLGGALLPLDFFPEAISQVLEYTPFPYLINFPLKILLADEFDSAMFISVLFNITIWTGIFSTMSYGVWKKGINKYSGVGQ